MPKGYPRAKIDPDADGIEMPTAAEVARWKSAHARIQAQIKGLSARADQLMTLIAAAEPLVHERQTPALKAPKAPRITKAAKPPKVVKRKRGRPKKVKTVADDSPQLPLRRGRQKSSATWPSVIHTILRKAGRGLLHTELREEVAKTELAERLAKSDKGFYGGIAKLADQEPPLLVKYKGRLFDPPIHKKFMTDVEAGRVADLEEIPHMGNASPFRDAILDVMKSSFTDGATSTDIIEALKKNPALAGTIQRHRTHAYNVLARMIEQKELAKRNEQYILGPKQLGGVFS
jgi:hypothetical protein